MNWKLLDCDVGQCLPYVPKPKPILGAAIAAGAGLIGSIAGSAMTNSANASMDRETREWQEKMWRANNEYNTPENQRKRLEQAGINPALAFQNGNTGVASSAPSAVQHTLADWSGIGTGFSQSVQYMLQASQVRANNDLLKSQTDAQNIENQTLMQRRIAEWNRLLADTKLTDANREWITWQRDKDQYMLDAYQKQAYADIERTKSETGLNRLNYLLGIDANAREWKKLQPTIESLKASARSGNASALLNTRNANIVPRLSNQQLETISEAYVDEMLKNASAEEIAGFGFKGSTLQELKSFVKNWLKSNMK